MFYTHLVNIEKKRTKASITLASSDKNSLDILMYTAVLAGASANCLKQVGVNLEDKDFDKIKELQTKFDNLVYDMDIMCTDKVRLPGQDYLGTTVKHSFK